MTTSEDFSLAGCTALVTGGGTGLGRAAARALARAGARVVVTGRTRQTLLDSVKEIEADGGSAEVRVMDVCDAADVEETVAATGAEHPDLAVLVNNAGIAHEARLGEANPADVSRVIATNLTGHLLVARAFTRCCDRTLHPSIINVSSLAGRVGIKGQVAYSASKGGVDAGTRSLALELAPSDVRVNAIAPGYFDTDMPAAVTGDSGLLASLERKIPMRRLGRPGEIGPAVVFLASRASAYVTGAVIPVDGGYTAQ